MKTLVVTHEHGLLPFAWRLHREGHPVEVLVAKERYAKAWAGRLPKLEVPSGSSYQEVVALVKTAAESGQRVLTDSRKWTHDLAGCPNVFGALGEVDEWLPTPLVGGWFDGERWIMRHLAIPEYGLWPGGLGPLKPGGMTVVWGREPLTDTFNDALDSTADALKSQGFKGLGHIGMRQEEDGLKVVGPVAGWPYLHTHAFVSDLASFGDLIQGMEVGVPNRFTVVLPVSVPPWPHRPQPKREPAPILIKVDPAVTSNVFFHDVQVKGKDILTAGLDGLVGVARGSADTLLLARQRAVEAAAAVAQALPERQLRMDVGETTETILAQLEALGLWVG